MSISPVKVHTNYKSESPLHLVLLILMMMMKSLPANSLEEDQLFIVSSMLTFVCVLITFGLYEALAT